MAVKSGSLMFGKLELRTRLPCGEFPRRAFSPK
jgi:hypothetical protein